MADLSYRIRTEASSDKDTVINVPINGTFDMFEILTLELSQKNLYKLPEAGYGVLVGRVLANGNFGLPNAKISVFIPYNGNGTDAEYDIYPYATVMSVNHDNVRYNVLSSDIDDPCHQDVGTFPTKRYMLDNGDVVDVFDKYYKYTTSTNNAGDYMIYGVPVGVNQLHVDVDLSDIGVLSQAPRDMIYKGYNINQFESPTKFRKSENLNSLAQIYSQNKSVYVYPFWGDTTDTETSASITRCDIKIDYKFEPTCVFMGSVITDGANGGISKRCNPSTTAGKMSELRTGEGMMEMIRKTPTGKVEYYSIEGNKLIDGDGVWCYQIPMNLDYVMTDEFGNIVPTDDPDNGIPTRACVRFRASLTETGEEGVGFKRARYLIPNNPNLHPENSVYSDSDIDFEFGSLTKDESFRDLFWNHVYTVKNYVPRLQKSVLPTTRHFTGIKAVNHAGDNNPVPYNNIQIRLGFVYRINCMLAFVIISLVTFINIILTGIAKIFWALGGAAFEPQGSGCGPVKKALLKIVSSLLGILFGWWCNPIWKTIGCGIELRGWCESDQKFFPGCGKTIPDGIYSNNDDGIEDINESAEQDDGSGEQGCTIGLSGGDLNGDHYADDVSKVKGAKINNSASELMECVQSDLAEENEVVSLNFQNDWINGSLYMPLWGRKIRRRKFSIFSSKIYHVKDIFCNSTADSYIEKKVENGYKVISKDYVPKNLKLFHNCAQKREISNNTLQPLKGFTPKDAMAFVDPLTGIEMFITAGTGNFRESMCYGFNCDKMFDYSSVNGGVITEKGTMYGDLVYYYKPSAKYSTPVHLFSTDIVLLGNLNSCDGSGTPQFFKKLPSTTYKLPPNLVVDDLESSSTNITVSGAAKRRKLNIFEDGKVYRTETTGADWGVSGSSQASDLNIVSVAKRFRSGGLFYGLTCNFTSVSPKSCVNLARVCEYGVGLDESKYLLSSSNPDGGLVYLSPDGFISTDEIEDTDGRSMFATLNGNGLKTKENSITGYPEYDFKYSYQQWFDKSLYNIMLGYLTSINNPSNITYKNNYKLEEYSDDYVKFRYGEKGPLFYTSSLVLPSTNSGYISGNRIPEYNNSFYFYFGLKEGRTAIDKFRQLYYSECEQDKTEDSVSVDYEPNTWCSEYLDENGMWQGDGYISLDLENVDTPYSINIDSREDNSYDFYVDGVTMPRVYLGNPATVPSGFQQLIDNESNSFIPLINGVYVITVTDANSENTSFVVNFTRDKVSFSLTQKAFQIGNDELFDCTKPSVEYKVFRYCFCGSSTTNPSYPCIASYYNHKTGERDIGGLLEINIKNDGKMYQIDIISSPGSSFEDFSLCGVTVIPYEGESFRFHNVLNANSSSVSNVHNNSYYSVLHTDENPDINIISVGVPKGDISYIVTVSELCGDQVSGNSSVSSVEVSSYNPPTMFVNGIDCRLIENFMTHTEWTADGGLNLTPPSSDNVTDANIWVYGFDNIGGDAVHTFSTDIESLPQWSNTNHTGLRDAIEALSTTSNSGCNYSWTDEYMIDQNVLAENIIIPEIDREQLCDSAGNTCDITVVSQDDLNLLDWAAIFGESSIMDCCPYFKSLMSDNVTYMYFRKHDPSDDSSSDDSSSGEFQVYIRSNNPITAEEFFTAFAIDSTEKVGMVTYVNSIVQRRIDLVEQMKRAFWVSGDTKTLEVTCDSSNLPIKTLIFRYFESANNSGNGHAFGILDESAEENVTTFDRCQIVYDSNHVLKFGKDESYDGKIEPFYCAVKDSGNLVFPANYSQQDFDSHIQLPGMSSVMFFKRPTDFGLLSWGYVEHIKYPTQTSQNLEYIARSGILSSVIRNGIPNSYNGNLTYFDEQEFDNEDVDIVTTSIVYGSRNEPDEYAFPTERKICKEPYGQSDQRRDLLYPGYSPEVDVYKYDENGVMIHDNYWSFIPLEDKMRELTINDGTDRVSATIYGNLKIVPDYEKNEQLRQYVWDNKDSLFSSLIGSPSREARAFQRCIGLRHKVDVKDEERSRDEYNHQMCFCCFKYNIQLPNVYDKSNIKYGYGQFYPLNDTENMFLTFYTYDELKNRVNTSAYLIKNEDNGIFYAVPEEVFQEDPYENALYWMMDNYNALLPTPWDNQFTPPQKQYYFIQGAVGIGTNYFALAYSQLYEYNVAGIEYNNNGNEKSVTITATNSYLRYYPCTIKIYEDIDNSLVYSLYVPQLHFNDLDKATVTLSGYTPQSNNHVTISVTDATGMEHYSSYILVN